MNRALQAVPKLNVTLSHEVKLEELQDVIERIYKLSGCEGCGRLSFTINAIDPEIVLPVVRDLGGLGAVRSVDVIG